MGVAPEAGKKYFCKFYWLDKNTGFTGESMAISAICKESSTAYAQEYVPRIQYKADTYDSIRDYGYVEDLDFELIPGSIIVSNNMKVHYTSILAGLTLQLPKKIKDMSAGYRGLHMARSLDRKYRITLIENFISCSERDQYISITSSTRGGQKGIKDYELFSTALASN